MRINTRFLLWVWIVLAIVTGSLIYSAYSKLNHASLVSLLNKQVQKNYPGSDLSIGDVSYGISIDFSLNLKNLTLHQNGRILAMAKEVQLKIPWWLILLNRGHAQLNISSLDVFVAPEASRSGSMATNTESSAKAKRSERIQVDLPQYLLDAQYTLRAKDISVKEIATNRRIFSLSKLLVRQFQYGKNSAFELNIPVTITLKDKVFSSELWLFGDVTPELTNWSLNYRGEFKTKDFLTGFEFDDLVIDGKSTFNQQDVDLVSLIDLSIDRKKVGVGELNAKHDQLKFEVKLAGFPLNLLNLIGDEIKNPFWPKIEGQADGEIKYSRRYGKENGSSLSSKLSFPGEFTLAPNNKISGKWHLSFENEKWETSFLTPKGEISFFRRSVLNFEKGLISQYSQEIGFNGVDMKTAMLAVEPLSETLYPDSQPLHSTFISLSDCLEGDRKINGSFRYGMSPFEKFYKAEMNDSSSKMTIDYLEKSTSHQLRIEFNDFWWRSHYRFLEPYFTSSEGKVSGKVEGDWPQHWSDGTWLLKLKAANLSETSGDFIELNQTIWNYFSVGTKNVRDRDWNASVQNGIIKLHSVMINGADPAIIKGSLSSAPLAKSHLSLKYPKNKKWKPVKKEIMEKFWKKEDHE